MCETCGCGHRDSRTVDVRRDVLSHNAEHAAENRARLAARGAAAVNVIGSPGAGKTALLEAVIPRLRSRRSIGVIEGDLKTALDAERIARTGVPVHQINTGDGCHLDAGQVARALDRVSIEPGGLLLIENVGNLVCPASFDLGETLRVVVLSTPEGDDKVDKYPIAFVDASALVISKIDLLPYVGFSVARCREVALALNPRLEVFEVSARTGEGLEPLCDWLGGAGR